jgi:hypothetical protein
MRHRIERILRSSGLLLALLLGATPWAQAQVAVPELAPAAVRLLNTRFPVGPTQITPISPMSNIVPENPAALQWGSPSRIGGGVLQGDMSDLGDGTSNHYRGKFAGLRWVKQRVALAADTLDYSVQLTNLSGVVTDVEHKKQSVALSFSLPESLAWGVGSRSLTFDDKNGVTPSRIDSSGWNLGLSWRIGQILFLGAGLGHDTASLVIPPPAIFVGDAERDYHMEGIGLRGTGAVQWHLEADSFHTETFVDSNGNPHLPGYDMTLYTAEVQIGAWLFGYAKHALSDLKGTNHVNGYTVDFGLAPFSGLAITGRSELTRRESMGTTLAHERVTSAAILWQF